MRARLLKFAAVFMLMSTLTITTVSSVFAGEAWSPLLMVRFGNIDAIDAEDGELARFVKNIRNDSRFPPPMRTLVGPELKNPTFFGLTLEGWVECVVLAPAGPGPVRVAWAFPVDSRDEYLTQMTSQGLTEYEGMDGVTVFRELDADGNIRTWHLQWLPGNVAVFGPHRESVMAARRIYADQSAARGLLHTTTGRFINPDIIVRLDPPALAAWQDREAGLHWWREKIDKLTRDLIEYWSPGTARQRLIFDLADRFAMWPRSIPRLSVNFWFEPDGVEFQLDADVADAVPMRSQLDLARSLPDRTAAAVARPVTPETFAGLCDWIAGILLEAAGGVVTREARASAETFRRTVADGGVRQMTAALVPPPANQPELGGCRLFAMDWQIPEQADRAWELLPAFLGSDETLSAAFMQMGVRVFVETEREDPGTLGVTVRPASDADAAAYYRATWSYRRNGNIVALVTGEDRADRAEQLKLREYRGSVAATTVAAGGDGGADVREAFTRMGTEGASWLGLFEPVRFLQFCLIEAGDWQPRSPDQTEPLSTQLAREMLEYHPGRAWTGVGIARPGHWRFDGGVSWDSLSRLAAALGITESISM